MSHFEVLVQTPCPEARRLLARTDTDVPLSKDRCIKRDSCNENRGAADENVILPHLPFLSTIITYLVIMESLTPATKSSSNLIP